MPTMRRFCASLAGLLLITACSGPEPFPLAGTIPIYVIHRAWHTDIALPVDAVVGPLATVEASFPGVRFLTFGFGERQFLVNRERTFGAMLGALLPSRSALLFTALRVHPAQAFGTDNVVMLHVTPAGLSSLEAAIWREFEMSGTNAPALLATGPYPGSVYYAARDTYYGLYTCNTWTADILRAGGLPMPSGLLFAGQVTTMARWISANQTTSQK